MYWRRMPYFDQGEVTRLLDWVSSPTAKQPASAAAFWSWRGDSVGRGLSSVARSRAIWHNCSAKAAARTNDLFHVGQPTNHASCAPV